MICWGYEFLTKKQAEIKDGIDIKAQDITKVQAGALLKLANVWKRSTIVSLSLKGEAGAKLCLSHSAPPVKYGKSINIIPNK
jgi:hypothetical protein